MIDCESKELPRSSWIASSLFMVDMIMTLPDPSNLFLRHAPCASEVQQTAYRTPSGASIIQSDVPGEPSGSPANDSKAICVPSGDHEGAPS